MSEIIETTKAEVEALFEKRLDEYKSNEAKKKELEKPVAPVITDVKSRDEGLVSVRTLKTVLNAKERGLEPRRFADDLASKTNSEIDYKVAKGLNMTDFVGGGALVPDTLTSDVIPYLHNASVFYNKIRQIPMSTGSMSMAKITGTTSKYWGLENDDTKASQHTFGQIQLNSRKVKVVIPISKHLITGANTAGINAEQIILNDIVTSFAPEVESQILRGSGVGSEILGVYNRMNAANKFNTAGVTFANVVTDAKTAISKIVASNVKLTKGQWVMSNRSANHVKFLRGTSSDDLKFIQEVSNGTWFGYDFGATNYIPDTLNTSQSEVYLLDLDAMVIGVQQGLTIEMSDSAAYNDSTGTLKSAFTRDEVVIQVSMLMDFGMYYDTAASVIEQVAWV